jgi:acyl-[acyl-carrier-protein]-phospholipid O-acyltransferase/long-chain-fatty-acid--[acyl-carrier-protein] ligase
MFVASLLFGFFGGLFIVPLNAMVQFFAPDSEMGTTMAGNNLIQNFVMIALLVVSIIVVNIGFSSVDMFLIAATILLVAALYSVLKLPHLFLRLLLLPLLRTRYSIEVNGIENLPQRGSVLLLGNHISWIDWLILQIASPRAIKFVMDKEIYYKWYVYWILRHFKVIPISEKSSRSAIALIRERLDNEEVVALFPEGGISRDGTMKRFKKGFEFSVKDSEHLIVPFNIQGLWGSRFSRSKTREKVAKGWSKKRHIKVTFGEIMPTSSTADEVQQAVESLGS